MAHDMVALDEVRAPTKSIRKRPKLNAGLCRESDLDGQKNRAQALFDERWDSAVTMFQEKPCVYTPVRCANSKSFAPLAASCDALQKQEAQYWSDLFRKNCHVQWPKWHITQLYNDNRYKWMSQGHRLETSVDPAADRQIQGTIDRALKSGELAAIGYDVSFVRKEKVDHPESHWSSVVGRHLGANGICYYEIRNSWGPSCKFYNSSKVKCANGNLTVAAAELIPRVHSVHYFDQ